MDKQKNLVKVCLGPFVRFKPYKDRIMFAAPDNALVPKNEVMLDNTRIVAILSETHEGVRFEDEDLYSVGPRTRKGLFYVVYLTENLDFYRPYLAKLPGSFTRLDKIKERTCPKCGSMKVEIVDDDHLYCHNCDRLVPWHYSEIWTDKGERVDDALQGEGIYVAGDSVVSSKDLREIIPIGEGEENLGNVKAKTRTFYGYIENEACLPREFAVYRSIDAVGKIVYQRLRDLTDEERLKLAETVASRGTPGTDRVLAGLARECFDKNVALKIIMDYEVYKTLPWKYVAGINDEVLKPLYIKNNLEKMKEHLNRGELIKAEKHALELNRLGYSDELVEEVKKRAKEEEKRMKGKIEEELKKVVEEAKAKFSGLPVNVKESFSVEGEKVWLTVSLQKKVDSATFQRYLATVKSMGGQYDPDTREWRIILKLNREEEEEEKEKSHVRT